MQNDVHIVDRKNTLEMRLYLLKLVSINSRTGPSPLARSSSPVLAPSPSLGVGGKNGSPAVGAGSSPGGDSRGSDGAVIMTGGVYVSNCFRRDRSEILRNNSCNFL